MRVAQLIESLGPGGAEKLAVQIASGRAQVGDQSSLITLVELEPQTKHLDPNVTIHSLGMDPSSFPSMLGALARLGTLCRRLRLDCLQTHLPRANYFGLALAMSMGTRVFPTIHNNREFDYGVHIGTLRGYLRRLAYRRLLVQGQYMIAISDAVKEAMIKELELEDCWSGRIKVVPNGVNVSDIISKEEIACVRESLGVPTDSLLVVAMGRLTEQKNFRDLIDALAGLGDNLPRWDCVIAGAGPLRQELANQIQTKGLGDRIRLAGYVPDVHELLGASDIFCIPSLWEGLPLSLLEAMSAGLPVVGYAIDGVSEVVREGVTGGLVKPGCVEDLKKLLSDLILDNGRRRAMGKESRREVERNYSLTRMIVNLGKVYVCHVT